MRAGPHTLPPVEPPPSQQMTAACCDRPSLGSPSVTSGAVWPCYFPVTKHPNSAGAEICRQADVAEKML